MGRGVASARLTQSPLLLGCLPRRITGVAGRLLLGLEQGPLFCLLGRLSKRLFSRRALGLGFCLRRNLGLPRQLLLLALSCFFTLSCARSSRGDDGFALLSFFDGSRIFD